MRIAIICQDTFPLICDSADKITKQKCCEAGALGKRSYQFLEDFTTTYKNAVVDVFIPHYNFPEETINGPYFHDNCVNYISYNFKKGLKISDLVDVTVNYEDVKKYDYVLIQTSSGVNFKVVSDIPERIGTKVIVDNWVPFLQEQDINLKRYGAKGNKKYVQFKKNYDYLLMRADIIFYDNMNQRNYIEGFLHALGDRVGTKKLVQYKYDPFTSNKQEKILLNSKTKPAKPQSLLWYGPIYPWYDIKSICCFMMLYKKFKLTLYGVRHPRYSNYYDSTLRGQLIEYSYHCSNIHFVEQLGDVEERDSVLSSHNAVIILDDGGIESRYAVRVRILDLLAKGVIVITNSTLPGVDLPDGLYKIGNSYQELFNILNTKLKFSTKSYNMFFNLTQNNTSLEAIVK